jgi:hypothetical protein
MENEKKTTPEIHTYQTWQYFPCSDYQSEHTCRAFSTHTIQAQNDNTDPSQYPTTEIVPVKI